MIRLTMACYAFFYTMPLITYFCIRFRGRAITYALHAAFGRHNDQIGRRDTNSVVGGLSTPKDFAWNRTFELIKRSTN